MIRYVISLACVFVCAIACFAQAPQSVVSASVKIVRTEGNTTHSGSGTIVATEGERALVLTNKHVVPRDGRIIVHMTDGTQYEAAWLGVSEKADLGALAIRRKPTMLPIPLASDDPQPGEAVYQAGYPGGGPMNQRAGRVIGFSGRTYDSRNSLMSFPSQPGDSGSGVFRGTDSPELVSVVWGQASGAMCVPATECREFCGSGECHRLFPNALRRVPVQPVRPPTQPIAVPRPGMESPDLGAILAKLEALQKQVGDIKPIPGPPGERGPPGPQGPAGPGAEDAASKAELDRLRKELAELKTTVGQLSGTIRVTIDPNKPK